jgi:cytosine/adenosine deaminase-related metal-dependent hydrolase
MKAIQKFFPDTGLNDLLKWATLNGARALRMDKRFGTFEIGKQPGINLISKADLIKLKLTSDSKVKRIA